MKNILNTSEIWQYWHIGNDLKKVLETSSNVILPQNRDELINLSTNGKDNSTYEVFYDVDGKGKVAEATVVRCKNGIAVNYMDPYMRRRDPNCMVVNNIAMTDKVTFKERFQKDFDPLRQETLDWLASNELILVPFMAGGIKYGYPALMVAPKNAAFLFVRSIFINSFIVFIYFPYRFIVSQNKIDHSVLLSLNIYRLPITEYTA